MIVVIEMNAVAKQEVVEDTARIGELSADTNVMTHHASELPARFKQSHRSLLAAENLNIWEQKLFGLLLKKLATVPEDEDLRGMAFKFKTSVIASSFKTESKNVYQYLKPACIALVGRQMGIYDDENEKFNFITLFNEAEYDKGVLTLYPHYKFVHELRDYAAKGYALINSETHDDIRDQYALRLYKILSRFKKPPYKLKNFTIRELQVMFGILDQEGRVIGPSSLASASNFVKRVILKSITYLSTHRLAKKELSFSVGNEGDLGVDITRHGNRYHSVSFLNTWDKEILMHHNKDLTEEEWRQVVVELETKRKLDGIRSFEEHDYQMLYMAYTVLGKEDRAQQVLDAMDVSKAETMDNTKISTEDLDNFLQSVENTY